MASRVEAVLVDLGVAGSIPVAHPSLSGSTPKTGAIRN